MHLYLIRHAQSISNQIEYQGMITDLELSNRGEQQLVQLANWVQHELPIVTHMYTSTLIRASLSAHVLGEALNIQPKPDNRLREIGTCRPDGQPLPLPVRWNGFLASTRPLECVADGSETWNDFLKRIERFITHIQGHPATSVIMCLCHSGTLEAINDTLLRVAMPRAVEWATYHTSLTHWQYVPERAEPWIMQAHNMILHLANKPLLRTGCDVY